MSRARTPETWARIRRWSRVEDVSRWILLAGAVAFVASVPVGTGLAVRFWIAGFGRFDVFAWLYGSGAGVMLIAAGLDAWAGHRLAEARLADGRCTVGTIEKVVEDGPSEVQGPDTLIIGADVPAHGRLRRRVTSPLPVPGAGRGLVGRTVRFRHRTHDPDDVDDVRVVGWPDEVRRTLEPLRPEGPARGVRGHGGSSAGAAPS
ncbi:hypothetical protein [Streptomyces sp. SM13]|uniref:hypothetical protein n=1 Tax=Streptomyces sp. SM13 TaxID=1983803 RepID=UPI00215605F1|nr:hypothetical protein [Streptomyces sp. SM13]